MASGSSSSVTASMVPSSSSATAAMVRENALRSGAYHHSLRGAQRIDNLEPGGTHGGEEAANQAHGEGEGDGLGHDRRRERKAKREVGERLEVGGREARELHERRGGGRQAPRPGRAVV